MRISKYLIGILLLTILITCDDDNNDEITEYYWPLDSDSANFTILLYDYPSFTLTDGYFQKLEKCTDCSPDSIPLTSFYRRPGSSDNDGLIGWIYNVTGDTLLKVNTGAWGFYWVEYPSQFFSPDSFVILPDSIENTNNYKFYQSWVILTYPDSIEVDTTKSRIWDSIKYYDIIHDYANDNFSIGVMGFAPKVAVIIYR